MIEFNATFIAAMLSFVVFMFIMNAIFYNPILNIIRKRESYIEKNNQESEKFMQNAEKYNLEHAEKLDKAKEEGRNKVTQNVEKTQKETYTKIQEAKEKAKDEIRLKKENLINQKNELQKTIESETVNDIAQMIVSKITTKKA